uniref:Uncharacterized protein n=1 Tax=Octopus bimaculoides TaxID=37653 RepID=A0A0L8G474_OCTBM
MRRFDAEYKKLREKEMVLTDSNKYLQKMIEQSEKQLKEKESQIETRQGLDEKQVEYLR